MFSFLKKFYLKQIDLSYFDWTAPLAIRLYLSPIMLQAGWNKYSSFENTVAWFEHSLNLPFPTMMAALATGAELIGGAFLLLGLAIQFIVIPLMVVMLVAAFTVHWGNGWLAISDASSWLANDRVLEAVDKKERAILILQEHGHYEWLTSSGSITVLNNGIEFSITYFIMLLALFVLGAGRFISFDYWVGNALTKEVNKA